MAMLTILIAYLVIIFPLFAVVLRAAVALANKVLPAKPVSMDEEQIAVAEAKEAPAAPLKSADQAFDNPFQAPASVGVVQDAAGRNAIPTPGFGRAYLISLSEFVSLIVFGGVAGGILGASAVGAEAMAVIIRIGAIGVAVPLFAAVLSAMLPTTYLRGLLVGVLQLLVGVLLLFVVGLAVGMITAVL